MLGQKHPGGSRGRARFGVLSLSRSSTLPGQPSACEAKRVLYTRSGRRERRASAGMDLSTPDLRSTGLALEGP